MEKTYVKASEISEYLYCKRSWWLRFTNQLPPSERMLLGAEKHEAMASNVRMFKRRYVVALLTFLVGILLLTLYFLITAII